MAADLTSYPPLSVPTDILGPSTLTPPRSTEADSKDGDDVIMGEEPGRLDRIFMESPPPDFEEEPSDMENEVMTMMEEQRKEQMKQPSFVSTGLLDADSRQAKTKIPLVSSMSKSSLYIRLSQLR